MACQQHVRHRRPRARHLARVGDHARRVGIVGPHAHLRVCEAARHPLTIYADGHTVKPAVRVAQREEGAAWRRARGEPHAASDLRNLRQLFVVAQLGHRHAALHFGRPQQGPHKIGRRLVASALGGMHDLFLGFFLGSQLSQGVAGAVERLSILLTLKNTRARLDGGIVDRLGGLELHAALEGTPAYLPLIDGHLPLAALARERHRVGTKVGRAVVLLWRAGHQCHAKPLVDQPQQQQGLARVQEAQKQLPCVRREAHIELVPPEHDRQGVVRNVSRLRDARQLLYLRAVLLLVVDAILLQQPRGVLVIAPFHQVQVAVHEDGVQDALQLGFVQVER
mmetsp:Transcript_1973/g.5730  ORF Transcript_1973/g.5730 Transcript_1973/m.5730 type:complete len:337 (-) Transcript_1973:408-1418(-)